MDISAIFTSGNGTPVRAATPIGHVLYAMRRASSMDRHGRSVKYFASGMAGFEKSLAIAKAVK
jgi:hypothetical protein